MLQRVLLAYARWNNKVGYCQGFNVIAAVILDVMERQEDCALKVRLFKKVKADIALPGNPISELRDVICHMGSHSVTCRLTQVNAPRLTPAIQAGTRFTYPGGMSG